MAIKYEKRDGVAYITLNNPENARRLFDAAGAGETEGETRERLLTQLVSKLEEHGIRDRNLWRLQHLVAEEIMRREVNPAVDWGGGAHG